MLNFGYDALSSGALIIDDGDMTMYSNAMVTHTQGTGSLVGSIGIDVQTGNLTINTGAEIDVDGKGYTGGTAGSGNVNGKGSGGGTGIYHWIDHSSHQTKGAGAAAYGGNGGSGLNAGGGSAYGSVTAPADMGSGGGAADVTNGYGTDCHAVANGGDGGGYVDITVSGTMTVDGSVTADGANGVYVTHSGNYTCYAYSGGGSGGGVVLDVGTLAGSGSIGADGGSGNTSYAGGAGGGRVKISYGTDSFGGTIGSAGKSGRGTEGGAGTVLLKQTSQTYGDLEVDNGTLSGLTTPLLVGGSPYQFDSLTVSGNGHVDVEGSTTLVMGDVTSTITGGTLEINGVLESDSLTALTVGSGGSFEDHGTWSQDVLASITVEGGGSADVGEVLGSLTSSDIQTGG